MTYSCEHVTLYATSTPKDSPEPRCLTVINKRIGTFAPRSSGWLELVIGQSLIDCAVCWEYGKGFLVPILR